jgi:hypothetical protein
VCEPRGSTQRQQTQREEATQQRVQKSCVALFGVVWRCLALYGVVWRCVALFGVAAHCGIHSAIGAVVVLRISLPPPYRCCCHWRLFLLLSPSLLFWTCAIAARERHYLVLWCVVVVRLEIKA